MFSKICRLFHTSEEINDPIAEETKEPLPPHDPTDWRTSETSTPWEAQANWCKNCKIGRPHHDGMSKICGGCGKFNTIEYYGCSIRKIWNGERWIKQFNEKELSIYSTGKTWLEGEESK